MRRIRWRTGWSAWCRGLCDQSPTIKQKSKWIQRYYPIYRLTSIYYNTVYKQRSGITRKNNWYIIFSFPVLHCDFVCVENKCKIATSYICSNVWEDNSFLSLFNCVNSLKTDQLPIVYSSSTKKEIKIVNTPHANDKTWWLTKSAGKYDRLVPGFVHKNHTLLRKYISKMLAA